MPSSFADVMAVGAASYAAEIAALDAAGLPTTFLHTGGGCTALQARCEAGRHLLITDAQDSLVWSRDAQEGWAVGAYRDDAAEEPESFLPRTDMEALCLCTLLWASTEEATGVVGGLTARDFHRPVYGELFDVITTEVRAMKPHDPASIAAALAEHGRTADTTGYN